MARVLSGRACDIYNARLSPGAFVSSASWLEGQSPAVSGCGHRQIDLGSSVFRFAQLESATASAHPQQPGDLPVQFRKLFRQGLAVRTSEHVWILGKEVWTREFTEYGHGGDDAGMCLADGTLYYSCYFGNKPISGVTAAMDPDTGKIKWVTTDHSVHAGCAPSIANGRLYLGGYNAVEGEINRVFCLDASTGKLVWKSDPVERAIHVVTIAGDRLFTHAQYQQGYLLDATNGAKLCELTQGYRCTRFTMDGTLLLGSNMDLIDTADGNRLLSSGPAVDVLQCVGAHVANGRLFYTANGSGLQLSMSYGEEAEQNPRPWEPGGAK